MPIRPPIKKQPDRIRNAIMDKVMGDSLTYRGPEHYVPPDTLELSRRLGDELYIEQDRRRKQATIERVLAQEYGYGRKSKK